MFTKRIVAARSARIATAMLLLCASVVASAPAAAAETLPVAERRAIEQKIRRQLDAFAQDDAEGAFGFATPDIRRMFGTSDHFMEMVRENYGAVYRSSSAAFLRLESIGGQWVQTVQIVDGEGRVWRALFTMKRQPDKSWKVGGCQLVQTSALAT